MNDEKGKPEIKNVQLDGKDITLQELEEAKKNSSIRIVEDKEKPGNFKTLKHLRG